MLLLRLLFQDATAANVRRGGSDGLFVVVLVAAVGRRRGDDEVPKAAAVMMGLETNVWSGVGVGVNVCFRAERVGRRLQLIVVVPYIAVVGG